MLWIKRIVLAFFLLLSFPLLISLYYTKDTAIVVIIGGLWATALGGICWWVLRKPKPKRPKPERYQVKNRGVYVNSVDPEEEDPEVFEYFVNKAWPYLERYDVYSQDFLKNCLRIQNSYQPYALLDLTADDFRMIGRARALQTLCFDLDPLNDEALQLIAKAPQLRFLKARLYEVTDTGILALACCKQLNGFSLSHSPKVTEAAWQKLLSNRALTAICFENCQITGTCLEAIRNCASLHRVQLLQLPGLDDRIFDILATLPNLKLLQIWQKDVPHRITSAGLARFIQQRMPEKLEIEQRLIDDQVLLALLKRGWLYGPTGNDAVRTDEPKPRTPAEVKCISLYDTRITDAGFNLIANCINVEYLHINNTKVTDVSIRKIANFKRLKYLGISRIKISPRALLELASLPITEIIYSQTVLSEDHFKVLGRFAALEGLHLYESEFDFSWIQYLRRLPRLRQLDLQGATLTPADAANLAKLTTLQEINLNESNLDDAGFRLLAKLPLLTQLSAVDSHVSEECCILLKRQRPEVSFTAGERVPSFPSPY